MKQRQRVAQLFERLLMEHPECPVCNEFYDGVDHQPVALPNCYLWAFTEGPTNVFKSETPQRCHTCSGDESRFSTAKVYVQWRDMLLQQAQLREDMTTATKRGQILQEEHTKQLDLQLQEQQEARAKLEEELNQLRKDSDERSTTVATLLTNLKRDQQAELETTQLNQQREKQELECTMASLRNQVLQMEGAFRTQQEDRQRELDAERQKRILLEESAKQQVEQYELAQEEWNREKEAQLAENARLQQDHHLVRAELEQEKLERKAQEEAHIQAQERSVMEKLNFLNAQRLEKEQMEAKIAEERRKFREAEAQREEEVMRLNSELEKHALAMQSVHQHREESLKLKEWEEQYGHWLAEATDRLAQQRKVLAETKKAADASWTYWMTSKLKETYVGSNMSEPVVMGKRLGNRRDAKYYECTRQGKTLCAQKVEGWNVEWHPIKDWNTMELHLRAAFKQAYLYQHMKHYALPTHQGFVVMKQQLWALTGKCKSDLQYELFYGLNEGDIRAYFYQLLDLLKYMHAQLTPDKILIHDKRIHVIGWGEAELEHEVLQPHRTLTSHSSNPYLSAPEWIAFLGGKPVHLMESTKLDIWAAGVMLYEAASGTGWTQIPDWSLIQPPALLHLLKGMLEVDPLLRWRAEACLLHPYFAECPPQLAPLLSDPPFLPLDLARIRSFAYSACFNVNL